MSDLSHAADPAGRTDPERFAPPDVVVRPPATLDEFRACVELQRETWGAGFEECVPAAILKVSGRIGGVIAGAFDGGGRLLGFVFGLTGLDRGRLVHWSHMLAVRPEWRDRGLGRRLKLYQREAVARLGVEAIYWTFDPLVARNAHLNLNRLGARVVEYVEDMYGPTGSHLHAGLGTDRLVIEWPVRGVEAAGERALDGPAPGAAGAAAASARVTVDEPLGVLPVVNGMDWGGPEAEQVPPAIRIEVPADVVAEEAAEPGSGGRWRQATRRAFQGAFARGYRVRRFYRDPATGRCFYVLSRHDVGGL